MFGTLNVNMINILINYICFVLISIIILIYIYIFFSFRYRKPTKEKLINAQYLEVLQKTNLHLNEDNISIHRGLDNIDMPEPKGSIISNNRSLIFSLVSGNKPKKENILLGTDSQEMETFIN